MLLVEAMAVPVKTVTMADGAAATVCDGGGEIAIVDKRDTITKTVEG